MAKVIHTLDGDFNEDGTSYTGREPRTMDDTPADVTTTGEQPMGFVDRIRQALMLAYPTKSQDANWLNSQVSYYAAKQGTEGKDDAYWIKRASGWQAGPEDQAEFGEFATPQDQGGGDGFDWDTAELAPPEQYSALDRPDYLQGEYVPPTWGETFQAPSMSELQKDPGYQARLAAAQKGFERSAAARGSILSGGSQVALGRQQQELAANEYSNAFGRAYDTYQQRYGQFQDKLTASAGARGINENAYQTDVTNKLNQYGNRYNLWRDAKDDQFRLADLGLNATTAGVPR